MVENKKMFGYLFVGIFNVQSLEIILNTHFIIKKKLIHKLDMGLLEHVFSDKNVHDKPLKR